MCRFLGSLPRALVATVMVVLACADGARGQTVSGSLFGTITDPGGNRLPGVTVTVSSPQLITGQEARTSGDEGTYRFPNLPPGTYTVGFELTGFQGLNREGIILLAGQSLPVDAQLQLAQIQETVTVAGDAPLVDTRNSALVNTADSQVLESIPFDREYTKILNLLPGIVDAHYDFAPSNNVHGSTVRQNTYRIDGISSDDSLNSTTATDLPVDALQEVQVTTAGITAEFGDASGAVFNYITKSGGNEFHGGLNFYYQGENTQSSNLSDENREQGLTSSGGVEKKNDIGVLLGGPINRNKAWFFANYRYLDLTERKPDFRAALGTSDHTLFAKGTVQLSIANKIEAAFHLRDYLNFPYTAVSSFRNSEDDRTWMGVSRKNYIVTPSWTSVINENTFLEVRGSISIFKLLATNPNNDGSTAYVDLDTGIISGGDIHAAGDNRRNRHQIKADLSHFKGNWLGGSHNLKGGFGWEILPLMEENFYQGARGPEELAGCSESCISATPDTAHLLFSGAPFQVQLYNSPILQRYQVRKWSAYAQDQWVMRGKVTLNLGVRLDHATGNLKESTSGGGAWDPRRVFDPISGVLGLTDIAPRFGVVWDLRGDHKTLIKGSAGRFYNQVGGIYPDIANAATLGFRLFDWSDRNGDRVFQSGEEGILRADTRPDPALAPIVDPDLENQYTDVYTIGYEQELGPNWAFAATGIFKRDGDLLGIVNSAVPFSSYNPITVTNPLDGQPLGIYTLRPEFLGRPGQTVLTNPGERPGDTEPLERKYDGVEIVVRKRLQNQWLMQSSYVYGKAIGNVSNQFGGSEWANYTNPNFLINRLGDLPLSSRHQFKLYGAYLAPYGFVLSGFFEVLSGNPWTDDFGFTGIAAKGATTVRIFQSQFPQILSEPFIDVAGEPAGSKKVETQSRVDFRVEKSIAVGKGDLVFIGDVFNLFNGNAVIRIQDLRLDSPRYGLPAELQRPRQLRVGIRWDF